MRWCGWASRWLDRVVVRERKARAAYNHCIRTSLHQNINESVNQLINDRLTPALDMRTTLDIDDDLLAAAKELARRERSTAGQVVSRLLRHSLTGAGTAPPATPRPRRAAVAGFQPFPARPGVVATNEQVDALRDAEGL